MAGVRARAGYGAHVPYPETLPGQIDETIETIAELERRALDETSLQQRRIERLTLAIGTPRALYGALIVIAAWISLNALLSASHKPVLDVPPFFWLETACSVGAFLVTIMILTVANRQSEIDEQRSRLQLQFSLLAERKTAKIIQLLEELRYDLPAVPNRDDREAHELTLPTDPHEVARELERRTPARGEAQRP